VKHTFSSIIRLQNVVARNPRFGDSCDFPVESIGFPNRKSEIGHKNSIANGLLK